MDTYNKISERAEAYWQRCPSRKKNFLFLEIYTGLFIIAFLLVYSPFLLSGESFIWIRDGRDMNYPATVYIGRYIRRIIVNLFHGKLIIPTFDLNLALGGDVISSLNWFGFGDPLNLLTIFVPTKYIERIYNFLFVFRLYLAGLSFCALCLYKGNKARCSLVGAVIYIFCGYAIFNVRSPFFLNPLIQLPLLVIGIDLVIRRKSIYPFVFTVFYSALCGFYFLYMMTVTLGIYTLIQFPRLFPSHRWKEFFLMAGRIVKSYALGFAMAGIFIVPVISSYFYSSRSGNITLNELYSYGMDYYRTYFLRIIAPSGSFESLSLAAIVLFAVVLLFTIKGKKYAGIKLGLFIVMVLYILPVGGLFMHGFSYPSQRWSFVIALLLSYCVVEMLPTLVHMSVKQMVICIIALAIYTICVFANSKNRILNNVIGVAFLAITLATISVISCISRNVSAERQTGNVDFISALICAALIVGNVSAYAVQEYAKDQENVLSLFSKYGVETEKLESTIEREAESLLKYQDGRFDGSTFWRNRGMVWNVPTTWSWWNMTNGNLCEFWEQTNNVSQLGMNFKLDGVDQRTITNTLLSTKYYIETPKTAQYVPYGYSLIKTTDAGNQIYINNYALPWGYTYDNWISYDTLDKMNGIEKEESMLQSVALESNSLQDIVNQFSIQEGKITSDLIEIPYTISKLNGITWDNGILEVTKANATITIEFQMPAEVEAYLIIDNIEMSQSGPTNVDVTVSCDNISNKARITSKSYDWYFGQREFDLNLGFSEKERTSCVITFPKKGTYKLKNIELYAFPMDNYPERVEALRAEPLENIQWGTNSLTGTVDLSKDKILCVSVPYSKGWSATVDGEKTEILRGNYMFMCLHLTAGHHDIEFHYCSPGLKLGAALTVCSVVVLTVMLLVDKRKSRQQKATERKEQAK